MAHFFAIGVLTFWVPFAIFSFYQKHRIEKDNIQSIKVFEKLGAEYVGVDTLVRKAAIERFKEIFPDDDTSMLETPTILVYHL